MNECLPTVYSMPHFPQPYGVLYRSELSTHGRKMQPDGNDDQIQSRVNYLAKARSIIKQASNVDESRFVELLRIRRLELADGQLVSGNVVRLSLRPLIDSEHDFELKQGLEATISAVIECTQGRARMAKREQDWTVYAVISDSPALCQSAITWLAHKAMNNHWSLVQDFEPLTIG
ncbi:hypothetical protein [Novipirellula rosea]|uniref:hypothetical protein n=1 Tax=Novipirellula rosea TaxID=1031540 RepID=UPI0031E8D808